MEYFQNINEHWGSLKWYWKLLIILVFLRILNIMYRIIFESSSSKKRRQMIESGEIDLQKIYKMKAKMKEAELKENFSVPMKISQINGEPVEEKLSFIEATLAVFNILGEKILFGLEYFKDYMYYLLHAFLEKISNSIFL